ncbi:MAG: hypothetical protein AVDCRST_MAG60-1578, partial [uncultured Nocardioides sp.]
EPRTAAASTRRHTGLETGRPGGAAGRGRRRLRAGDGAGDESGALAVVRRAQVERCRLLRRVGRPGPRRPREPADRGGLDGPRHGARPGRRDGTARRTPRPLADPVAGRADARRAARGGCCFGGAAAVRSRPGTASARTGVQRLARAGRRQVAPRDRDRAGVEGVRLRRPGGGGRRLATPPGAGRHRGRPRRRSVAAVGPGLRPDRDARAGGLLTARPRLLGRRLRSAVAAGPRLSRASPGDGLPPLRLHRPRCPSRGGGRGQHRRRRRPPRLRHRTSRPPVPATDRCRRTGGPM